MNPVQQLKLPVNSFFSEAEIVKYRSETTGTKNKIHLNNAGAGLMPDVVTNAMIDYLKLESEIGGYEAAAFRKNLIDDFYQQTALLLNCKPSNIAFTSSATDSYSRALSSIPFKKDDVILADKDNFVSNQIQFLSLQKRFGVRIIHIENAQVGGVDVNDLKHKLEKYQPKLLTITHIPTNSGLVQPVHNIAKVLNDHHAKNPKTWYILDACQSAGQIKLDVKKLGCDFLSMTGRKYLRGPRGTGILYISDEVLHQGLEPMFIDMRGAEWIEKSEYRQQADAKRFEDWEFAYATVVGTKVAMEYCLNIGEDKICKQVRLLADFTRIKLSELDKVTVLDRGLEKGGLVTFHIKDQEPKNILDQLLKSNINVVASYRAYGLLDFDEKSVQWALRASPHYYNTPNEIEYFVDTLKQIIK